MNDLNLNDLHNPNHVDAILLKDNGYISADKDQAWQEYPGSYELWQKMDDGRLMRVQRWLKKSVIATYKAEGGE